ncbi:DUF4435 domain-containing protein [Sinorhizobium garamanticum]|uniref:DUF4435 domain-containing protein n=1 Tax=Sinorhizobium garamanticum TaxID=680247 RepID=A0ABY8D6C1_9HYPH|nr:DUF4435 domain-containing protein [Sinorhizobium garamanticum]WEX86418.1 DUF4435 domain-containing protein [Sinorhizobium garamanticum]
MEVAIAATTSLWSNAAVSKIELTVPEIVATIKKSSIMNIVIEGKDDVIAYRNIEDRAGSELGVVALLVSAGGRDKVLQIHDALVNDAAYTRCLFICDRDFWIFSGIPIEYQLNKILTTEGYSIESDLFRDYDLTNLLTSGERPQFLVEVEYFKRWFSYNVARKLRGESVSISAHVNEVVDQRLDELELETAFVSPGHSLAVYQTICSDPVRFLRGKSYLALCVRKLSASDRRPKHSSLSLFEHAVAARGALLRRLEDLVIDALRGDVQTQSVP